mmetsp:Transcript_20117/g.59741  ORF Transcript_20117/g.59741 Transcript_20117/m.59741 type:complete len:222 (+) Transcript_20117:506-1171(+)
MHRRPVKGAAQHLCLVHVKAGQRADACPEALVQESQQVYNVLVAPVLQLARRHGLGQPRLGHLARQAQARAGEQVAQRKRADAEHLFLLRGARHVGQRAHDAGARHGRCGILHKRHLPRTQRQLVQQLCVGGQVGRLEQWRQQRRAAGAVQEHPAAALLQQRRQAARSQWDAASGAGRPPQLRHEPVDKRGDVRLNGVEPAIHSRHRLRVWVPRQHAICKR